MDENFLDELTAQIDDSAEGERREGPLRLPVLVVPAKIGPRELEAACNGLGRELHNLNLDRCAFEEIDFHTGETTAVVGELDELEQRCRAAIEQEWEPKIQRARLQDEAYEAISRR